MPQFELQQSTSNDNIDRIRARDPESAIREWLGLADDEEVTLEKGQSAMEQLEGWQVIRVGGVVKGRVRPHQRMRFRRD